MALDSKYNNYSERDKQVSNLQHLDILDANTDEIEGKLDTIAAKIDTLTSTVNTLISTTNSRLATNNSLLQDIKNNTTPGA